MRTSISTNTRVSNSSFTSNRCLLKAEPSTPGSDRERIFGIDVDDDNISGLESETVEPEELAMAAESIQINHSYKASDHICS